MRRARVQSGSTGKPTRDDVARLADLSGSTVSRVFSPRDDIPISAKTRAKVLAAAKELGYLPNSAAQALTNGRSGVIGFWICLEYSRYRGQVIDAMRAVLGPTRTALSVSNVDEEYRWDQNFSRAFRASVDGIIAFDSTISLQAFQTLAPSTPFVSMGAIWSEELSYVGIDLRAGTQEAMVHLFSRGWRKIALVVPRRWGLHDRGPRFEAYRDAMIAEGLTPEIILTDETEVAPMRQLFEARERLPEAMLCINDDVAISAARALAKMGIRPGYDVGIVGFDGIRETEEEPCPITTVRQPIEKMCTLALDYLQQQMDDPSAPLPRCILNPVLEIRESTRPVG